MESNREQIELISSDLEGLTPDNAQYDSLINERIPYLDQNMDLDLYSKIALAGGAVSILLGIIFFFVGKKK
ncbi:MAG: hypothetical protein H6598_01000 [Flavobacteriales bacterium]|nr:hypothetical protein [Flavobacteriales bacterium]